MSRQGKRVLAGAAVGALLLALFFRGLDLEALATTFSRAESGYLVAALFATVATYAVRAWRWGGLLSPIVCVPFGQLFSATVLGFMAGLVVPRAGEILRPYLVARRHPIKTSTGFASIVLERLVDLITVLALFALYLTALAPGRIDPALRGILQASGLAAAAAAAAALLALLALHFRAEPALRVADRIFAVLPTRLGAGLGRLLRSFAAGLAVLHSPPRRLLALAGQSLLVWLSIAASIYWTNLAFGIDVHFAGTFLMLGVLTVGVAIPTPGMVGGYHEAYLISLTQAFGVDRQAAAAAAIACHAISTLPVLVLGLVFLAREGLSLGQVAHLADKEEEPPPTRALVDGRQALELNP